MSYSHSTFKFSIMLLFNMIAFGQDHLFVGPIAPKTESAEHAAIRVEYETAINLCEADEPVVKPAEPADYKPDPEFDKKWFRFMRSENVKIAKQKAKNDMADGIGQALERYQEALQREANCEQSEVLEPQLEFVDSCLSTYHQTIDKKSADLTVRESELVKGCQSLNLYPPSK